jgi:peptidyl-prolyl cis-trans isomerase C
MFRGERLRRIAREPLVHFLVAGLLVFAFASWRGVAVDPADRTIAIDESRVTWLTRQFEQTWQRAPNPAEIDQLIRDYIKEEIYYREALRMGLDQDDAIIRRRLRSKMEFLAAAEVESVTPSDADLRSWFDRNASRYASDARASFEQIFIGTSEEGQAAEVIARLNKGGTAQGLGQPISLPVSLSRASRADIARTFGDDFADALLAGKAGQWSGPIASGFGSHIVRISAIEPGEKPSFESVRNRVENDWRAATLSARQDKAYQTLLDAYTVRIEKP